MLQLAGHPPEASPAPPRPPGDLMFWVRTAAAIARDACAALFIGLLVGTLILRIFFVGPLAVAGVWVLLSLI